MLVDVVELDWHGLPKDRAEVLAATPVRAHLSAERLWSDEGLDRAPVHADLRPMLLETLYSARLRRWKGVNIVIEGWQRQPAKGRQTGGAKFPQRWWVRIVLDPATPPMSWTQRRDLKVSAGQRSPRASPNRETAAEVSP